MNKLSIPKTKRVKGLFIYCNKCNTKCSTEFKSDSKCDHPYERLVFKAIFRVPNNGGNRTKILSTKDLNEAIKQTIDFETELKTKNYKKAEKISIHDFKPEDLKGCIQMYIDYLVNKNVYKHQVKIRTSGHIKQIEQHLIKFLAALKERKVKINNLLITDINNYHVEIFYNFLIKQNYANRTFNRYMDAVSELYKYLIERKQYNLVNYFSPKNVQRKSVNTQIDTISISEFKSLLSIIKPENEDQIQTLSDGTKKYHYFDWLVSAFELALFSGRRRDEIINMKFSDIHEQDGIPMYIKTEDYKFNLRKNLFKEEEKKYNYTPVIFDLNLFLQKIGYNKYKNTNRYLIAPDSLRNRETLKIDMSKSFTHYFKQLKTGKNLSFKHLRKTYITLLNLHTNGAAQVITGQSGQEIIQKNYHDHKIVQDVIRNFQMVG